MLQRFLFALGVVVLVLVAYALGRAQSLADLARAEEARRKAIQTPSKVYTNDDLRPDREPPAPTAAPKPGAAAETLNVPKPTVVPAGPPPTPEPPKPEAKDETYWRNRITAARTALDRNVVLLEALQSRVNALTTDFVNMDDPAQRAVIEQNRLRALAEMERLKKEMADQSKTISDIEEEARRAAVPPGWLR